MALHSISGIDGKSGAKYGLPVTWLLIYKSVMELDVWNISFNNLCERKPRAGDNTHLWKDMWYEETTLKDFFQELYKVETQKEKKNYY